MGLDAEVELTSADREGIPKVSLGAGEGISGICLGAEVELTSVLREGVADGVGRAEVDLTSVAEDLRVVVAGVDVQCGPSAVMKTRNT